MASVSAPTRPPTRRPSEAGTPPLRARPERRRRNVSLASLAVLLIVGCGMASVWAWSQAGDRREVLSMNRTVPQGAVITDADLVETRISVGPGVSAIPAAARAQVVGRVAGVTLVEKTLLSRLELAPADRPVVGPGQSVVAVALKPGQAPELHPGDQVSVVVTGSAAGLVPGGGLSVPGGEDARGAVLVRQAQVHAVSRSETTDTRVVSLLVETKDVAAVAGAANVGEVALSLVGA